MPLADLLRAIEDDAAAARAAAVRAATVEAAAIVENAHREAETLEATLAAAPEVQTRGEAEQETALARLAAAATIRDAREDSFASLLAGVRTRLSALRGSAAYPARFRALVVESRAVLPRASELRVDPRDVQLAESIATDLRVVAVLDTAGGVELVDDDGRTVRNTLEERFANADLLLRRWFMRWLATSTRAESARDP
jgi:vacuolar-type H+-ATPase subunit E/Vma4